MAFTVEKRKSYSAEVLNQISSMGQDNDSIASKQQSIIDDYDDTNGDDYKNRQAYTEAIEVYSGITGELAYLDNYGYNKAMKLYDFIGNRMVNIKYFVTAYGAYSVKDHWVYDNMPALEVLPTWNGTQRDSKTINNYNNIYDDSYINTDGNTAPNFPSSSEIASSLIAYGKGTRNLYMKNTIPQYLGIISEYCTDFAFNADAGNDGTISVPNKGFGEKYSLSFPAPASLPETGEYFVCPNSDESFYQLCMMDKYTVSLSYALSADTVYSSSKTYYNSTKAVYKYSVEGLYEMPSANTYVLTADKYYTSGKTYYSYDEDDDSYTAVSVPNPKALKLYEANGNLYTYEFSVCSENNEYHKVNGAYVKITDTTLYPFKKISYDLFKRVLSSLLASIKSFASSAKSAYIGVSEANRVTDLDPESAYKSIISLAKRIDTGSQYDLESSYTALDNIDKNFTSQRISALMSVASDTIYSDDIINSINARLDKNGGSLFTWYQGILSTDKMYADYKKKLTSVLSYFKRLAVLPAKVQPGEQCFHTTNEDGTVTVEVSTYSQYASSKGTSASDILSWKEQNPDSPESPYWIYVQKNFSEYYAKAGKNPSIEVGDKIYILDDNKPELCTTVTAISYDKVPSGTMQSTSTAYTKYTGEFDSSTTYYVYDKKKGYVKANITSFDSSTTYYVESSITTEYEDVMRLTCLNRIPTDYILDSNLRIVKEI